VYRNGNTINDSCESWWPCKRIGNVTGVAIEAVANGENVKRQ